jgi:segregation and condensation protein B
MKKQIDKKIKKIIESILLVAEKPVSIKELASCTEAMSSEVQKALAELIDEYKNRGIKIIKKGEYFSLVTDPENAEAVSKFLNEELRHDLSDAAIETLSIITYKQPVTRVEIEEIRGAQSDQILRNLLIRGLITEVGRKEAPGRPILYGTTMEFMQYFGFENEEQIPKFEIPTEANDPELFQSVDTITIVEE